MTSRIKAIDVTVPGTPEGFTLSATMSVGNEEWAQASFAFDSPVRAFRPSSIMVCTAGAKAGDYHGAEWKTSTTRPGKSPGMPSGDNGTSGVCRSILRPFSSRGPEPTRRGRPASPKRAERGVVDKCSAIHVFDRVKDWLSGLESPAAARARVAPHRDRWSAARCELCPSCQRPRRCSGYGRTAGSGCW